MRVRFSVTLPVTSKEGMDISYPVVFKSAPAFFLTHIPEVVIKDMILPQMA